MPQEPAAADLRRLTEKVKTDAAAFERVLFWRDVRETAAGALVAVLFGYAAWSANAEGKPAGLLWTAAALPLASVAFLLWDRKRHSDLDPVAGDAVIVEIDRALRKLRHQVWLLRNVLWWYILPIGAAGGLVVLATMRDTPGPFWVRAAVAAFGVAIIGGVNVWVWRLNQGAVRNRLEPAIADLEAQRRMLTG